MPSANDGLFRRVKVIEIEPIPEAERDPEIKERIKGEGAGILNWALDGLERLRKRGGFEIPVAVRSATARWREMNDVPAMFVAEECETGEGRSALSGELYLRYQTWCAFNGHKPKSRTHIAEDWRRLGFKHHRDKHGAYWLGVALRGGWGSLCVVTEPPESPGLRTRNENANLYTRCRSAFSAYTAPTPGCTSPTPG